MSAHGRPRGTARGTRLSAAPPGRQFEEFNATELYCPRCGSATPVSPRLLLVLSEGELYNYHCTRCGDVLGRKTVLLVSAGAGGGTEWDRT